MKRPFFIFLIGSTLLPFTVLGQIVTIPDNFFKQKLLNHSPVIDTNGDNQIQLSEAMVFSGTLDVAFIAGDPGQITDLTGIEAFGNIETLEAGYNAITQMNLSENTELRVLNASGNLYTSLDFSNNPNLEFIQSNFGNLSSIHIQNNPNLAWIHIQGNQLTTIDISHNPLIQGLNLDHNPITQIDTSLNPMLRYFRCRGTEVSSLDFSNNGILISVVCQDNPYLTYINLKNGNNAGLNISGTGNTCEFYDLPNLETVCLDELNSPLSDYISNHVEHEVNFTEECLLSIDNQQDEIVTIYPNPAQDILNIYSKNVIRDIIIVNIMGETVYNKEELTSHFEVILSPFSEGLYLIKLTDENGNEVSTKFIKTN